MVKIATTLQTKTCKQCSNIYYRNQYYSDFQWSTSKYCSYKCVGSSQRIHANSVAKQAAFRRRHNKSIKGSQECNEKISILTKLAMQHPDIQEKIRKPKGALSLERRMQISNNLAGKMPKNNAYNNSGYSNIQRGYYDINGDTMYFRSKWEANYALYLDWLIDQKQIYKWEFEPDTFMFEAIKLGTRSYTPDFKVFNNDGSIEYHEVKGYMDSKSKTKLKRFKKYYPDLKLVLIDTEIYLLLKKQIGKLVGFL